MDFSGLLRKEIDRKRKATLVLNRKRLRGQGTAAKERAKTETLEAKDVSTNEGDSERVSEKEEERHVDEREAERNSALVDGDKVEKDTVVEPIVGSGKVDSMVDNQDQGGDIEKAVATALRKDTKDIKDAIAVEESSSNDAGAAAVARTKKYSAYLQKEDSVDLIIDSNDILNVDPKLPLQIRKFLKDLLGAWTNHCTSQYPPPMLLETKRDVVKLMYKLRSEKLDEDVLVSLATIVHYIQTARFVKASEAYLQLSIGNVAWPIGVREVGIHARAADAKIAGSDNQKLANIMKGESTRRWLVAVKRLISYSEAVGGALSA